MKKGRIFGHVPRKFTEELIARQRQSLPQIGAETWHSEQNVRAFVSCLLDNVFRNRRVQREQELAIKAFRNIVKPDLVMKKKGHPFLVIELKSRLKRTRISENHASWLLMKDLHQNLKQMRHTAI